MSESAWFVAGVIGVVLILAATFGPRIGRATIKFLGVRVDVSEHKQSNGANVEDVRAGRDLSVTNTGDGSSTVRRSKADRDVSVKNETRDSR